MDDVAHPFRPAGGLPPAPLAPYGGPWNERLAAHLLRRAGFGGSPAQIAMLGGGSMHGAVDSLIKFPSTAQLAAPPAVARMAALPAVAQMAAPSTVSQMAQPPLDASVPGSVVAAPSSARAASSAATGADASSNAAMDLAALRKARRAQERNEIIALQQWWLDRMIATPAPLQEKMTLFWHGHFTTAAIQKGVSPAEVLAQNMLFRAYALGSVRELTQRVALDPAMLRYLDNVHNEVTHPNENFARELMELYTLGIGNYTETDVREAARAWTGLRVRRATGDVFLNARLHDDGLKTFLGRSGNFGGSDIVNIIFEQPAAARFLAAKLLTYFVYADPEPELVDGVAGLLRSHDFVLEPVLGALFSSNVFYSARAYRALVKSPAEFVVGAYRSFGRTQADPAALAALRRMTQILFYPPNVKGWPGGSAWLNSSTVLARENFAHALTAGDAEMTNAAWLTTPPADARSAAATIVDALIQGDASPSARSRLEAYLGGSESETLAALSPENLDARMRGGAYLAMAMPAYQLA